MKIPTRCDAELRRVLIAVCGIAVIAGSGGPAPAHAASQGAGPAAQSAQTSSDARDAAAAAREAALESEVAALEARIAKLEADADEKNAESAAKPVHAPFTVVNGAGQALFTVGADGAVTVGNGGNTISLTVAGGPKLALASGGNTASIDAAGDGPHLLLTGNGQILSAGPADGAMTLSVEQGASFVRLAAKAQAPLLEVSSGAKSAWIGQLGSAFGLAAGTGARVTAGLVERGDDKYALNILPPGGGQPVLQAGYHSTGRPALSVWDGDKQVARLDSAEGGGGGELSLFKGSTKLVSLGSQDGADGLSVYDGSGGEAIFAGTASDGDPSIRVSKGKNLLAAMSGSTSDPDAGLISAYRGSDRRVVLDASGAAGMRVYANADKVLSAFVGQDGIAGLSLDHGSNPIVQIGANENDPTSGSISLLKAGAPMLEAGRLSSGGLGLQVTEQGDEPAIDLSVQKGSPGLSFNKDGQLRAFIGSGETGDPFVGLFSGKNRLAELTSVGESGALTLYKEGTRTLSVGANDTGASRPAFRAYDSAGKTVFAAGSVDPGVGVVVTFNSAGQIGAELETDPAGNGSVFVQSQGKPVASITSADKPGEGLVVVRNPAGAAVATLGMGSSGGGNVTTADPSGNGVFSAGYIGSDGPGTACVEHKGTKCLGIGLTGMEGFH